MSHGRKHGNGVPVKPVPTPSQRPSGTRIYSRHKVLGIQLTREGSVDWKNHPA